MNTNEDYPEGEDDIPSRKKWMFGFVRGSTSTFVIMATSYNKEALLDYINQNTYAFMRIHGDVADVFEDELNAEDIAALGRYNDGHKWILAPYYFYAGELREEVNRRWNGVLEWSQYLENI